MSRHDSARDHAPEQQDTDAGPHAPNDDGPPRCAICARGRQTTTYDNPARLQVLLKAAKTNAELRGLVQELDACNAQLRQIRDALQLELHAIHNRKDHS